MQLAIADDLHCLGDPAAITDAYKIIRKLAPPKDSGETAPEPWALKVKPPKMKLYCMRGIEYLDAAIPPDSIPAEVDQTRYTVKPALLYYSTHQLPRQSHSCCLPIELSKSPPLPRLLLADDAVHACDCDLGGLGRLGRVAQHR